MEYTDNILKFINKIQIDSPNLYNLVKATLIYQRDTNPRLAEKSLKALTCIANTSQIKVRYGRLMCVNIDDNGIITILIPLTDNKTPFSLTHEFEHIIHICGANHPYESIIEDLNVLVYFSIPFKRRVRDFVMSEINPYIENCVSLSQSCCDIDINNKLLESCYNKEIQTFIKNREIDVEKFLDLNNGNSQVMEIMRKVYPEYYHLYGFIGNLFKGHFMSVCKGLSLYYDHSPEYFKKHGDVAWLSEIIAEYSILLYLPNCEDLKMKVRELLGREIYDELLEFYDKYRDITINSYEEKSSYTKII